MKWLSVENFEWGWVNTNSKYIPKTNDQLLASETLLKIIYCRCTLDCATFRCVCRKNGLQRSSLCGPCQEKECENSSTFNYLPEKKKKLSDSSDNDFEQP